MERCDSMAILVNHEHITDVISASDSDSEGTCSGYDSAPDLLDEYEDDHQQHLPDILKHAKDTKGRSKEDLHEKMCFKSTNALSKHLKYVMSLPELCDVKFLVGEEKYPVYGVKAIMATRSRTFYHLIVKHQRKQELDSGNKRRRKGTSSQQHLTIDVRKYEPEVFQRLIQFVHCGSVDVSTDNVIGLLCGATQFGLDDLRDACWDFVDRCLQQDSINEILSSARNYSQHKITKMLITKINRYIAEKRTENKLCRMTAV